MTAAAIIAAAIFGLVTVIAEYVRQQQAQSTGAQLASAQASAASNAVAATTQAAIAQAEAAAPTTRLSLADRLKAGTA